MLSNKVVLITGAAHRIGATTARMLHAEGLNILLCEFSRAFANARVHVQRATASLGLGNHNLTSIPDQDPNRGVIQPGERQVGNTTRKKSYAVADLALGLHHLPQPLGEKWLFHSRSQSSHTRQPS